MAMNNEDGSSSAIVDDLLRDFAKGDKLFDPEDLSKSSESKLLSMSPDKIKERLMGTKRKLPGSDANSDARGGVKKKKKHKSESEDKEKRKKKSSKSSSRLVTFDGGGAETVRGSDKSISSKKSKHRDRDKSEKRSKHSKSGSKQSAEIKQRNENEDYQNSGIKEEVKKPRSSKSSRGENKRKKPKSGETVWVDSSKPKKSEESTVKKNLSISVVGGIKAVKMTDYLRNKGHDHIPVNAAESVTNKDHSSSDAKPQSKTEIEAFPLSKKTSAPAQTLPAKSAEALKSFKFSFGFLPRNVQRPAAAAGTTAENAVKPPETEKPLPETVESAPVTETANKINLLQSSEVAKPEPDDVSKKGTTETDSWEAITGKITEVLPKPPSAKKAPTEQKKKKKKPLMSPPSPGPPIRKKLPQIDEEEHDELPIGAPLKRSHKGHKPKIVIGSLKSSKTMHEAASRPSTSGNSRYPGEEGEIPSSNESISDTSDVDLDKIDDTDGELKDSDPEHADDSSRKGRRKKDRKLKRHRRESSRRKDKNRHRSEDKKYRRSRSASPYHSRRSRRRSRDRSRSRSYSYSPDRRRRDDRRGRGFPHRGRGFGRGFMRRGGGRFPPNSKDRAMWPWGRGPRHSRSPPRRRPVPPVRRRSRSRSHTGSPPRDADGLIDKKKLFEIARKNASAMLQAGTLQQIRNMSAEEIASLRAGGKSVDELVDYCRKLQKREAKKAGEVVSSSSEEETKKSDEEDTDFIHHPFALKPGNIVLNIPNAVPLPTKTPQERKIEESRLRITFPVSSGEQHRNKEWVPVAKDAEGNSLPAITAAGETGHEVADVPEPQHASFDTILPLPPPPPPPETVKVFEEPPPDPGVDIGQIVAHRLKAIKKLQDNGNDVEALKMLQSAEEQLKQWAESKNLPGQFTGSTGANCLTPQELGPADPRFQAWAKKFDSHAMTRKTQTRCSTYLHFTIIKTHWWLSPGTN